MKYLRPAICVAIAYVLAYLLPLPPAPVMFSRVDLPATIIFAAVFATFTALSITRRERLKEAISFELNKIRRIYHLGKNLSNGPYIRAWFTQLHGFVYEYLGSFDKKSIVEYDSGNTAFRKMAYHIYALPEIREVKEEALYNALVAAAGEVSEARQKISSLVKSRFWKSHWLAFVAVAVFFVLSVLAGASADNQFITFAILSMGLILADLYFAHDFLTLATDRRLARRYVENIAKLELKR